MLVPNRLEHYLSSRPFIYLLNFNVVFYSIVRAKIRATPAGIEPAETPQRRLGVRPRKRSEFERLSTTEFNTAFILKANPEYLV
jgi:hypothetical protein